MIIFKVDCVEKLNRWSKWYFHWPLCITGFSVYIYLYETYALDILERIVLAILLIGIYKISNKTISCREYTGFEVEDDGSSLVAYRNGNRYFDLSKEEVEKLEFRTFLGIFKHFVITDKSGFEYKLDVPDGKVVRNDIKNLRFV